MTFRTLIVDDEPPARAHLRQLLAGDEDIEIVGECEDGLAAVEAIKSLQPDLVFLDVEMPELDGFGVINAIGQDRMPATLFITAFARHAVQAFDVNAVDYLLKPFDGDRFRMALSKVKQRLVDARAPQAGPLDRLRSLLESEATEQTYPERILVRTGEHHLLLKVTDIRWIEAEDNYVRLHMRDSETHLLRHTLSRFLQRLDPRSFRRIHRSIIVNLECIKEIQPWFHGDFLVHLDDGTTLTLTRTHREALLDKR
jgi:two-component system LytT family response regulator